MMMNNPKSNKNMPYTGPWRAIRGDVPLISVTCNEYYYLMGYNPRGTPSPQNKSIKQHNGN